MRLNKNILVTGGAGYIGSHACKRLAEIGYNPITVDDLSTGWRDAVKFGPFEKVDIRKYDELGAVFKKYEPQGVMHFAGSSQVAESVLDPGKYWENNVFGSLSLFKTCTSFGCENVIFSSTCATYGNHNNVILDETTPQCPINAYGSTKRAIEEMLMNFGSSNDLRHVIFRYFNVAGADPSAEIGEWHRPETHLIPLILEAIDGDRDAIKIFGTDYDTPDGTCIRDYVHVCDLVEAHVQGLQWLEKGGSNAVFNLGTGLGFSVREVIRSASKVTNKDVPIVESERRRGDCAKLVSGSALAQMVLGWEPKRSTLEYIIGDAWRWHNANGYLK